MASIQLRPIERQVVAIVGCSSGIGRQAARRFAERHARLVLVARSDESLDDALDDVRARGASDAIGLHGDVTVHGDMQAVARAACEAFGRLDTWVHVAAVSVYGTAESTRMDEYRRVVEVNLLGPIEGARAALPALRESGGGALIVITSVEAEVPLPYQAAYSAAKHGAAAFLRTLRMELRAEGAPIAVTNLMPASIDTPLFRNARSRIGVMPRPVAPVYDPDVVADQILWAAEHPSGDLFAGGAGWAFALAWRLAPGLTERILSRLAMPAQRTNEPEAPSGDDNLDAPLPRTDRVRGGFGGRSFSLGNRLQRVPAAVRVGAVLVGAVAVLAAASSRRG
jgi:NAD(P)-dependent dehydrogenase (short-subunit alcohol dehydrogenase family)